jgi:hypothetical protein
MAYALVQSNHTKGNTLGSLAFPGAVTAGNLLELAISYDAGATITTVTGGGTWVRAGTSQTDAGNGQKAERWYCLSATGGATTVTWNGNPNGVGVVIKEVSRSDAQSWTFDTANTAKAFGSTSTTANAETSNSITPAAANEYLSASIYDQSGTAPTFTAGTGWTLDVTEPGTAASTGAVAFESKTGGSGAQSATFTVNKTGDSYTVQIAAFGPALSGGGTTDTFTVSATGSSVPVFTFAGMTDTFTVSTTGRSVPAVTLAGMTDPFQMAATGKSTPTITLAGMTDTMSVAATGKSAPVFTLAGMTDPVSIRATGSSSPSFGVTGGSGQQSSFISQLIEWATSIYYHGR